MDAVLPGPFLLRHPLPDLHPLPGQLAFFFYIRKKIMNFLVFRHKPLLFHNEAKTMLGNVHQLLSDSKQIQIKRNCNALFYNDLANIDD